ncbi:MAG: tRNA pseudouridine(55) synthase TruB [Acidimicrobiales bacterium]
MGSAGSRDILPGGNSRATVTGELSGLVVVDKEEGWTSHDVVARIRRLLGQRRIGHAGTLDPDATGVLLIGVGRFTRALRFLAGLPKTYRCEMVLGSATNTLDASGEVVDNWDMSGISLADVKHAALGLTGEIEQIPPMFSAVKVDGERLYSKARRGETVERKSRRVTVHSFEVMEPTAPGIFPADVVCSTGTYVRTLVADLGSALGGGAHLRNLQRISVGSFSVDDARAVEEVSPGSLMTPAQALRDLEQVHVDDEVADLAKRRMPLDKVSIGAQKTGPFALVDGSGRLVAVYEATATDRLVVGLVL